MWALASPKLISGIHLNSVTADRVAESKWPAEAWRTRIGLARATYMITTLTDAEIARWILDSAIITGEFARHEVCAESRRARRFCTIATLKVSLACRYAVGYGSVTAIQLARLLLATRSWC